MEEGDSLLQSMWGGVPKDKMHVSVNVTNAELRAQQGESYQKQTVTKPFSVIDNRKGNSKFTDIIEMNDEEFNIYLVLEIYDLIDPELDTTDGMASNINQETKQILKHQMFVQSKFESRNKDQHSLTVSRVASLKMTGWFEQIFEKIIDLFRLIVPAFNLIWKKSNFETLHIQIGEDFNNQRFALQKISIDLY